MQMCGCEDEQSRVQMSMKRSTDQRKTLRRCSREKIAQSSEAELEESTQSGPGSDKGQQVSLHSGMVVRTPTSSKQAKLTNSSGAPQAHLRFEPDGEF